MEQTSDAAKVRVGFHPDGYMIDKTASPMERYTKWDIAAGNQWTNPKPVCFDSLPQQGWFEKDKFDWDKANIFKEQIRYEDSNNSKR